MDDLFEEVECEKVFKGKLVGRCQQHVEGFEIVYRLYETPRQKLACVVRKNPAWSASASFKDETWGEMAQDSNWWKPQYQLHIADNYEELEQLIGQDVVHVLQKSSAPKKVEYLDI